MTGGPHCRPKHWKRNTTIAMAGIFLICIPIAMKVAKLEVPKDNEELAALQARLRKRFPVDAYNKARRELDPNHILSNNMLEKLFPQSDTI